VSDTFSAGAGTAAAFFRKTRCRQAGQRYNRRFTDPENAMSTEERRSCTIRRRREPILINGRLDEPAWQAAEVLRIDRFLETVPPERRNVHTTVRLLWDDWNLYVGFHSLNPHIESRYTVHNAMVWLDTCVEFFVSPEAGKPGNYYTWEVNCCGVSLNKCQADFWPHDPTAWLPTDAVATSVPGPTKQAAATDKEWSCELVIPFSNFVLSPATLPPKPGDIWRANFQQCAGPASHQATWSPLPPGAKTFHTPAGFGELIFGE
jgi:hypothetical protein